MMGSSVSTSVKCPASSTRQCVNPAAPLRASAPMSLCRAPAVAHVATTTRLRATLRRASMSPSSLPNNGDDEVAPAGKQNGLTDSGTLSSWRLIALSLASCRWSSGQAAAARRSVMRSAEELEGVHTNRRLLLRCINSCKMHSTTVTVLPVPKRKKKG